MEYRRAKSDANASFPPHNPSPRDLLNGGRENSPTHSIRDAQAPPRRHESSDARAYHDDSFRGPVAQATGPMNVDTAYNQSKKGYAVHSYFKDRQFTGAPEQSVDTLLRDYEICAEQQCLDPAQMSLFFVNALADPLANFSHPLLDVHALRPYSDAYASPLQFGDSQAPKPVGDGQS